MKIAVVTHYYNSHGGGVEIAAYNLSKELIAKPNIQLTWFASDCDVAPVDIPCIPLKSSNFIEKIFPFPYPILYISSILKLFNYIKLYDFIIIHDFIYLSNIIAYFAGKKFRKKIIITQHIGFIPYKNRLLRFILSLVNNTIGRFILTKADNVIFISQNVLNYFSAIVNKNSHFIFIPNSTNTEHFRLYSDIERNNLRNKFNLDKFTFLFVGRFTEKKGLETIRKIAEKFQNCIFIFVGWGQIDPDSWELENVVNLGKLDSKNIAELYNASDVLILPSYGEGFPLVVQEALSSGLGLIVSNEIRSAYPNLNNFIYVEYDNSTDVETFHNDIFNFTNSYNYDFAKCKQRSLFAQSEWSFHKTTDKYYNVLLSCLPNATI